MADNVGYTPGTGASVAADEIGGVLYQRVKPVFGVDGVATDVSATDPLPVTDVTPAPTVTITSVQTDASGAAWTAFTTAACNSLDIVNATNVDIEYRRNGAGTGMPIPARSSRSVLGIANADEISVRRVDQLTTQVTIHAEVFA